MAVCILLPSLTGLHFCHLTQNHLLLFHCRVQSEKDLGPQNTALGGQKEAYILLVVTEKKIKHFSYLGVWRVSPALPKSKFIFSYGDSLNGSRGNTGKKNYAEESAHTHNAELYLE